MIRFGKGKQAESQQIAQKIRRAEQGERGVFSEKDLPGAQIVDGEWNKTNNRHCRGRAFPYVQPPTADERRKQKQLSRIYDRQVIEMPRLHRGFVSRPKLRSSGGDFPMHVICHDEPVAYMLGKQRCAIHR